MRLFIDLVESLDPPRGAEALEAWVHAHTPANLKLETATDGDDLLIQWAERTDNAKGAFGAFLDDICFQAHRFDVCIKLGAKKEQERLIEFYEKRGFTFYDDDDDYVVMIYDPNE